MLYTWSLTGLQDLLIIFLLIYLINSKKTKKYDLTVISTLETK